MRKTIVNLEGFVDVVGYEGLYLIHPDGRVYGIKRGNLLRPYVSADGYARVKLSKEGKVNGYLQHRLVAKAFIPNPNNLPFINHKDEDKTNNHVDNLEWCTSTYNNNYGTRIERVAKNKRKAVVCNETGKIYKGVVAAAEALGICPASVSGCCNGKYAQTAGYTFRFATEEEKESINE